MARCVLFGFAALALLLAGGSASARDYLLSGNYAVDDFFIKTAHAEDAKSDHLAPLSISGALGGSGSNDIASVTVNTGWEAHSGPYGLGLTLNYSGSTAYHDGLVHPGVGIPESNGFININMLDSFQLVATAPKIKILPNTDLFINAELDGNYSHAATGRGIEFEIDGTLVTQVFHVSANDFSGTLSVGPSAKVTLDSDLRTNYGVGLGVNFHLTGDGDHVLNLGHTFKLTSITFADGTTPEEYGYDIVFDSGRLSPNISAVPEPASFAIAGIGAVLTAGYGLRRRRNAATI
jgi:hypothetical protein